MKVLIIDDDPGIRVSLREYLRDFDMEVSSAKNAEEAFQLLAEQKYDVAIVDLRMRGESGREFILKAHRLSPATRFLIYTGSADHRLSDELRSIGIRPEHVFLKPQMDLELLVNAIRTAAASH